MNPRVTAQLFNKSITTKMLTPRLLYQIVLARLWPLPDVMSLNHSVETPHRSEGYLGHLYKRPASSLIMGFCSRGKGTIHPNSGRLCFLQFSNSLNLHKTSKFISDTKDLSFYWQCLLLITISERPSSRKTHTEESKWSLKHRINCYRLLIYWTG